MKIKRLISFGSALLLSLSSLLVFVPKVAAATITWDGGGVDSNFSTAQNWVGDVVPSDGDVLTFDNSSLSSNTTLVNDLTSLSLAGIDFTGSTSNPLFTLTGNPITLTGNITTTTTGMIEAAISLGANIAINGSVTTSLSLNNNATPLALNGFTLTINNDIVYIGKPITGTNSASIVVSGSLITFGEANPGYNGTITINGGRLNVVNGSLGSATGPTVIQNEGELCYDFGSAGNEVNLAEPFNFQDGKRSGQYPVFSSMTGCSGGVPGAKAGNLTLTGTITLAEDTIVDTEAKITITGTINGNYSISMPSDSVGQLILPNGTVNTVDAGDSQPSKKESVYQNQTLVVKGTRGDVTVNSGGTLKGTGTVGTISVASEGTIAPGLSPGCLNSGNMTINGTFEVEIGGTTVCTEYDQLKVTGTVNVTNGTLDTSFVNDFEPEAGQNYVIIDNDAADAVTGTFTGLAEGATFTLDDVVFKISYVGGSGNDVVLTVQSVPEAPDTGFNLLTSNPIITMLSTSVLAGGIALLSRRYNRFSNRD